MASVSFTTTVEGVEGVQAMIMQAEAALGPPAITEALAIGADIIVSAAQSFAPQESGDLRNSIQKEADGPLAFTIAPGRGGKEIKHANITEHGGEISSGKLMVFEFKGASYRARHVTIGARPYMEPARDKFAEATAAITAAINARIRS
jgi:phage gpG-like protein